MDWKTLLAYITGSVEQTLRLRNEYLVTENRILRQQLKGRVQVMYPLAVDNVSRLPHESSEGSPSDGRQVSKPVFSVSLTVGPEIP
jgi:hypothetical protein